MQILPLSTAAVLLSLPFRTTAFAATSSSSARASTTISRARRLLAPTTTNYSFRIVDSSRLMSSSPTTTTANDNNNDGNNDGNHRNDDASRGLTDIGTAHKPSKANHDDQNAHLTWKQRIDISIAKSRKIRGSNYVQISTIDYDAMEPRCRTVVFRGFVKDVPFAAVEDVLRREGHEGSVGKGSVEGENCKYLDCVMKMITDQRSNKVKELEGYYHKTDGCDDINNSAEMVWWFPKSSEQYRVRGKLQFIGNDGPLFQTNRDNDDIVNYFRSERKQQWGNLSDPAREQFYWREADYLGTPSSGDSGVGVGIPPGGRDGEGKILPPPDSFLLMLLYPTRVDYLRLGDNFRQVDEWEWGRDGGDGCRWKSW
ncbi:hypothetical protein ACHAXS_011943 [Conticribra weissflogii]